METSSAGSVSNALQKVQAGDRGEPLEKLVERYFQKLATYARGMLPPKSRRVEDEEDVALEVFDSFCRALAEGRYKGVDNRDDLWKLLAEIMRNKVIDQLRRQETEKRGGGLVRSEADETLESRQPTPAQVAELEDLVRRLFEKLVEGKERKNALRWQKIAQLKLERYEEGEIAAKVGCSLSSVRRCAKEIRKIWSELAGAAVEPLSAERSASD